MQNKQAPVLLIFLFIFINTSFYGQTIPNNTFISGEKLVYQMSYGWIKGGEAKLKLRTVNYNGKKVYHVKAIGKTTGLANSLYNVYDVYESYFDIATNRPYKTIRDVQEGESYTDYNEVIYNHSNNTVKSKKSGIKKVKPSTFDVISAFYYLRRAKFNNIKTGDIIRVNTFFHNEPFDLIIKFKGYETINIKLGKIRCMKFKPLVEKGTFDDEEALDIWVSDDKNRIPVRIKMSFFIGSFKTDLINHTGLKHKFGTKK